ncbi:MAG: putative rane protein [Gaiellales bacterium]|jgi:putative membrane protein|nr:putative rane protein [Gaiellales bacterium]MDX6591901.1 putative rane protein [Gaiellales bacterium]
MTQSERRGYDESLDAIRRTRLANERTYLAWWRTGLTALAVSLAAGKVVPDLTDTGSTWPYEALGAGFALLGVACIAYGLRRERQVERALLRGGFVPADPAMALGLTAAGVVLGLLVFVLLATGH